MAYLSLKRKRRLNRRFKPTANFRRRRSKRRLSPRRRMRRAQNARGGIRL